MSTVTSIGAVTSPLSEFGIRDRDRDAVRVGIRDRDAVRVGDRDRASRSVPRGAGRRRLSVPTVLVAMSIALIPWMVLLGVQGEWSWVGLDVMEFAGLASTGLLLRRGDSRYALTASATFILLVTDAWFDITTSHGASLALAWVLALALELPIAAFCARLALRAA